MVSWGRGALFEIQRVTLKYKAFTPFTTLGPFSKVAGILGVERTRTAPAKPSEMRTTKTLIVEDNDTFRRTLRDLLQGRFTRMMFEEARESAEALQKIRTYCPDLIFMDIKLPGESGLEVTRRAREGDCRAVIIILTSYDLPEYREAAIRFGANHFVLKGSSTAGEILTLVDRVLDELGLAG
jgi:CheY-like chemotaxis protein